jgi:NMD protein affecting ribosome stability and mRNA decay
MRRERSKTHPAASQPRTDRTKLEHEDTFYRSGHKLPEPTVCPRCAALYREGRWTWGAAPADAHPTTCPACERIEKDYPAGLVTIRGDFARAHRDEIQALARNLEEREKDEHPLKRILKIDERGDELLISTTDSHLARGLGAALHHAFQGELDYGAAAQPGELVRIRWER